MTKKKWILASMGFVTLLLVLKLWFLPPNDINLALNMAEDNRAELKKVLEHFEDVDADIEKLNAARFLIANCIYHSTNEIQLWNKDGEMVEINPLDYTTPQLARDAKDSLFNLYEEKRQSYPDVTQLKADYLIKHIDFSINAWRSSPWKSNVSFDHFCQYILPYRVLDEALSFWPEILQQKYAPLIDSLKEKNILNACKAVNAQLAKEIVFDERFYLDGSSTQSVPQLLKSKHGNCDDLTVYGICAMRSLGIPVAVDFDIHGRYNLGHTWCAVIDENGDSHSFGAGEQQPDEHQYTFDQYRWRKLTRVFRRSFDQSKTSLAPLAGNNNTIPVFFQSNNIVEVTKEYIRTFDLEYEVPENYPQMKYLYLCIYNNQAWKPIQWGEIKQNKVVFPQMGAEIMYMVASFENGRITPISLPFILEKGGTKRIISGSGPAANQEFVMDKISGYEYVRKGKEYFLYHWNNNRWKYLRKIEAPKDSLIKIDDLNKNTLYRFENISRPFIIEDTLSFW